MQQGLSDLLSAAQNAESNTAAATPVQGTHIFGVTLIGATPDNLHKLLLTIAFIAIAFVVTWILRSLLALLIGEPHGYADPVLGQAGASA